MIPFSLIKKNYVLKNVIGLTPCEEFNKYHQIDKGLVSEGEKRMKETGTRARSIDGNIFSHYIICSNYALHLHAVDI